ncbi:nucleotide-binding domain-containing protein [Cyathus striatus]|nr:nucleotide-binding domain-containing protein [Cyathus striatus]
MSSRFSLVHNGKELVLDAKNSVIPQRSSHILIIGGGVTGLTTAWALLDAGYSVTVISDKWVSLHDRLTSQIAGALWEWPPAVCGKHLNAFSLKRSKEWCMTSYRVFEQLMNSLPSQIHGVRWRMANFFFTKDIESMPGQLEKMNELMDAPDLRGFKRDRALVNQHKVTPNSGVVDSYQHLAPVIDTDVYMAWLTEFVASKGAKLITGRVYGDLIDSEERLLAKYHADIIVNATGLGAFELASDSTVYPLRGALIRVVNDGIKFPKIDEALCVSHDDTHEDDAEDIVFIVPRNDRTLILGGLAQPNEYTLDLTFSSPEIVRMRERCNQFVPGLEDAEYMESDPIVQGLRPFTGTNVRVEQERRRRKSGAPSRLVHSYGQGGAGFSLSFGIRGGIVADSK